MTLKQFDIIGISASPRRKSNTDILVRQVLDTAESQGMRTEFVKIADMDAAPCDGCWACKETGECHISDDMQILYPKLLQADGIVIGTPVHMGHNVTGHAQIFLDRTFVFWHQKRLKNKVGGGVVVSNRRGGVSTNRVINDVLIDHQILIAGYATGYGLSPGDIKKDERALKEAESLGIRLCEVIRLVRG